MHGSVSFTPGSVGTTTLTGTYAPDDGVHAASAGAAQLAVTARATHASLVCVPNPVAVGGSSTCTATVTDASPGMATPPAGTVSFSGNKTDVFTESPCTLTPVNASSSNCSVGYSPQAGPNHHALTAQYSGGRGQAQSRGQTAVTVT